MEAVRPHLLPACRAGGSGNPPAFTPPVRRQTSCTAQTGDCRPTYRTAAGRGVPAAPARHGHRGAASAWRLLGAGSSSGASCSRAAPGAGGNPAAELPQRPRGRTSGAWVKPSRVSTARERQLPAPSAEVSPSPALYPRAGGAPALEQTFSSGAAGRGSPRPEPAVELLLLRGCAAAHGAEQQVHGAVHEDARSHGDARHCARGCTLTRDAQC